MNASRIPLYGTADHPDRDEGSIDTMLERAREQARRLGVLEGLERAAQWHDRRAVDTPDAFEMELHQACADALRTLAAAEPKPGEEP